jgi:hypothetical protein
VVVEHAAPGMDWAEDRWPMLSSPLTPVATLGVRGVPASPTTDPCFRIARPGASSSRMGLVGRFLAVAPQLL